MVTLYKNTKEWHCFEQERRFSPIDTIAPDIVKYPNFYNTNYKEIVIKEGECIFIPAGWAHLVLSEEPNHLSGLNIAISYWSLHNNFDEVFVTDSSNRFALNEISVIKDPSYEIYTEHIQNSVPFKSKLKIPEIDFSKLLTGICEVRVSSTNVFTSSHLKHMFDFRSERIEYKKYYSKELPETIKNNYTYLMEEIDKDTIKHILPSFLEPFAKEVYNSIWINYGNVKTHLHYDIDDNVLVQLQGEKRIYLFPPYERDNLYMCNPYPVSLILSLNPYDKWIYFDKNCLTISECNHYKKYIGTESSIDITTRSDIDILSDKVFTSFRKYINKLYSPSYTIHDMPFNFKIIYRSPSISDNLGSYIDETSIHIDNELKVYIPSYVCILFLNDVTSNNSEIIFYNRKDIITPEKGHCLIFPASKEYEYCFTDTKEEMFFIKCLLYKEIGSLS